MSPIRRGWLPGFVVGVTAGFAALEVGPLGWLIAIAFAVPALIVGPRLASIGGLLLGSGGIWLVLLGRVAVTCTATGDEIGCQAPGIEPWLAAGGVQFALGAALTLLATNWARRGAERRRP